MARIRHLAILTEDVDRLVKFYTNSFGLKIVEGVGGSVRVESELGRGATFRFTVPRRWPARGA